MMRATHGGFGALGAGPHVAAALRPKVAGCRLIGPERIFPTVELTVRGMEAAAAPIEMPGQVAGDEVKQ
jgi:hypothetical protein